MFLHTFLLFLLSLSLLFLQTSLLCHLSFSSDISSLAFTLFFRHLVSVLCTLPRTFLSFEHFFWYLFSVLWTLLWTSLLCPLHSSSDISHMLQTFLLSSVHFFRPNLCLSYSSSDSSSVLCILFKISVLSFMVFFKYAPTAQDGSMWSF